MASGALGLQVTDAGQGRVKMAGLVAGEALARVALFALTLKFRKPGRPAVNAAWAAVKRFFGPDAKESRAAEQPSDRGRRRG